MILTARCVRRPRKFWDCDWCGFAISGVHIYLYGAADTTDRPWAMRLHVRCCPNREDDPKIAAALAAAERQEG